VDSLIITSKASTSGLLSCNSLLLEEASVVWMASVVEASFAATFLEKENPITKLNFYYAQINMSDVFEFTHMLPNPFVVLPQVGGVALDGLPEFIFEVTMYSSAATVEELACTL
jgi:hypothetical protein